MGNNKKISLEVGSVINEKWVILEFIAKGGMGEVYRAHQLNLKRDVAIKVISLEWIETMLDDEEELENALYRFQNEMQTMAQVCHPNIVQIYDYGSLSVKGSANYSQMEYIVMEYVSGGTLRSTMSEEGFYPEEELVRQWVVDYFLPILDGVEALHEAGIIHRDLKPENVLLHKKIPKISDFGIARSSKLRPITQSSDMKGTPIYMPPEQFMDFRRTDARTDIYALGKILYEALDGRVGPDTLPFKQAKLAKAETPFFELIDNIIQKSTAEKKEDRYKTVGEMKAELEKALNLCRLHNPDPPVPLPIDRAIPKQVVNRTLLWNAIIIVAVLIGISVFWFFSTPRNKEVRPSSQHIVEKTHDDNHALETISQDNQLSTQKVLKTKDGSKMILIPGGELVLPEALGSMAGRKVHVSPYYMQESLISNLQYVSFLNRVMKRITVEKNVVKGDGKIWLVLGEALEGYEPIIYRDGRFQVSDPAHASCPVIRISAYGASAYANFYGRRLPTSVEWVYALSIGGDNSNEQRTFQTEPSNFPSPVLTYRPNKIGIRGLNGNISEWGTLNMANVKSSKVYVVLGGFKTEKVAGKGLSILQREAWEAFEEVGFRTVMEYR